MPIVTENEIVLTHLAANVSRLLVARGMSARQLAARTGESPMTISRVCRGITLPSVAVAMRIAEAFDVSIDRLVAPPTESATRVKKKSSRSA